jgi:signal peptidase II
MPKKKGSGEAAGSGKKSSGKGQWRWLWLTFAVIILDRLTKSMATYYFSTMSTKNIFFWLNFDLVHNDGAAFGFMQDQSGWQLWIFVGIALAVSIGILMWLWRSSSMHPLTASALSLILGGALGNLYDRITTGYVIDFIDLHYNDYHWPSFNLADSAICIGLVLLLLSSFRKA